MKKPQLLHHTRRLFKDRPRHLTMKKIARDTRLPLAWLRVFVRLENPSVNRVEILYSYLSGASLNLA